MSEFDPDEYLKHKGGFDPDAYLADKGHAPQPPMEPKEPPPGPSWKAFLANAGANIPGARQAIAGVGAALTPGPVGFGEKYNQSKLAVDRAVADASRGNPVSSFAGRLTEAIPEAVLAGPLGKLTGPVLGALHSGSDSNAPDIGGKLKDAAGITGLQNAAQDVQGGHYGRAALDTMGAGALGGGATQFGVSGALRLGNRYLSEPVARYIGGKLQASKLAAAGDEAGGLAEVSAGREAREAGDEAARNAALQADFQRLKQQGASYAKRFAKAPTVQDASSHELEMGNTPAPVQKQGGIMSAGINSSNVLLNNLERLTAAGHNIPDEVIEQAMELAQGPLKVPGMDSPESTIRNISMAAEPKTVVDSARASAPVEPPAQEMPRGLMPEPVPDEPGTSGGGAPVNRADAYNEDNPYYRRKLGDDTGSSSTPESHERLKEYLSHLEPPEPTGPYQGIQLEQPKASLTDMWKGAASGAKQFKDVPLGLGKPYGAVAGALDAMSPAQKAQHLERLRSLLSSPLQHERMLGIMGARGLSAGASAAGGTGHNDPRQP